MKSHLAVELAEHYLLNVESFCNLILEVLDLGTLATKVFLAMYQHRREWTSGELAREVGSHRQHVYRALRDLEKGGFVQRVSRFKWRIKM